MGMHTVLVVDNDRIERIAEDKVGLVSACLAAENGGAADALAPEGVTVVSTIDPAKNLAILHDHGSFRVLNADVPVDSDVGRRVAGWLAATGAAPGARSLTLLSVEDLEAARAEASPSGEGPQGLEAIVDADSPPRCSWRERTDEKDFSVVIELPIGGGAIRVSMVQTAEDAADAADSAGIWGDAEIVPMIGMPNLGDECEDPGLKLRAMPEWGVSTHHGLDLESALARSPSDLAVAVLGWLQRRMSARPVTREGGIGRMAALLRDAIQTFWRRDPDEPSVLIEIFGADLGRRGPAVRIGSERSGPTPWRTFLAADAILAHFQPWGGDVRLVQGGLSVATSWTCAAADADPDDVALAAARLWSFLRDEAGFEESALRRHFELPAGAQGFLVR